MGHRALGTNAWHFMRRLGVNGARVFLYSMIPCAQIPSPLLHLPNRACAQTLTSFLPLTAFP